MYLDPENQDVATIVRAILDLLRAAAPRTVALLLDQGAVFVDGTRDRVIVDLPGAFAGVVLDDPAARQAISMAVHGVLGPRFSAFLRDGDADGTLELLVQDDDDGLDYGDHDEAAWDDDEEAPTKMERPAPRPPGHSPFERIRRTAPDGSEYWSSRDLGQVLGYDAYRNFEKAVVRAKDACEHSGHDVADHFVNTTEPVALGKGAVRNVDVVYLSRYACYLAIQNADPRKPMVALGQTYFTVQTRRQELQDAELEESLRLKLREEIKLHNKALAAAAYVRGVRTPADYAIFNDHGYKGLYNGLSVHAIKENRGLKRSHDILDYMGSTELAANLFRATQTEELLRRGNINSKDQANRTHLEVGIRVREAMKDISGIMPEDLPVAESIKKVQARLKKRAGTGELGSPENGIM